MSLLNEWIDRLSWVRHISIRISAVLSLSPSLLRLLLVAWSMRVLAQWAGHKVWVPREAVISSIFGQLIDDDVHVEQGRIVFCPLGRPSAALVTVLCFALPLNFNWNSHFSMDFSSISILEINLNDSLSSKYSFLWRKKMCAVRRALCAVFCLYKQC